MSEINDKIDAAVLEYIRDTDHHRWGGCTSMDLGALISKFEHLPMPPESIDYRPHWCQELANRSCQRLRKKGLIKYNTKKGWMPVEKP